MVQYVQVPVVKGNRRIEEKPASQSDRSTGRSHGVCPCRYRVLYARGLAYLQEKKPAEAVQAFQRVLDLKLLQPDSVTAVARLGLARAYAQQGDEVRARIEYQNFLALWKDADADIPLLKEAKAEYEKVK